MKIPTFSRALSGAKSTIDVSVLVGGTLLWDNYKVLSDCVLRGVSLRFLFPDSNSIWLKEYLESMRVSHAEYVWKIRTNSDRARNLGAEVRFHKTPIAAWFTVRSEEHTSELQSLRH